jgi:hypothetical protein
MSPDGTHIQGDTVCQERICLRAAQWDLSRDAVEVDFPKVCPNIVPRTARNF